MLSTLLQCSIVIVMQIKLFVILVVVVLVAVEDVPSTFFISFPLCRPFLTSMNQNFCTNCIYVCLEKSMTKNNVTENVLRSSESFSIDDVNGNGRASNQEFDWLNEEK